MIIKKTKLFLYYIKRGLVSLFVYPAIREHDEHYNRYWHERKLNQHTLNSFQKKRAEIALGHIEAGSSVMDIGCGNGSVLAYVRARKPLGRLFGVDISEDALGLAQKNGIETVKINILDGNSLTSLPSADYIFLFEVLEHVPTSENLLKWAVAHSKKGVFFSVPNTGFITHRLRLLFGRFPLQWRVHPGEHIRFWTHRDMRWWLKESGHYSYKLHVYEGISLFNKICPSLFGQGLFVYIPRSREV